MNHAELECYYMHGEQNQRDIEEEIRPRKVLGLTRIKIARAIRLRLIEIPKGIICPRRAA